MFTNYLNVKNKLVSLLFIIETKYFADTSYISKKSYYKITIK
jgi:hypothetical protein